MEAHTMLFLSVYLLTRKPYIENVFSAHKEVLPGHRLGICCTHKIKLKIDYNTTEVDCHSFP